MKFARTMFAMIAGGCFGWATTQCFVAGEKTIGLVMCAGWLALIAWAIDERFDG